MEPEGGLRLLEDAVPGAQKELPRASRSPVRSASRGGAPRSGLEDEKIPDYLYQYRLVFLHLPKTHKAGEVSILGWDDDLPVYSDGADTYELKTGTITKVLELPTDPLTLEDNQKILVLNYSNGAKTTIYRSESPINPASVSTNGTQIAFTNETDLLIYSPKSGIKSYGSADCDSGSYPNNKRKRRRNIVV